jgi:hypothetical protein
VDEGDGNATVDLGSVGAREAAELLESWAAVLFAGADMSWSCSIES